MIVIAKEKIGLNYIICLVRALRIMYNRSLNFIKCLIGLCTFNFMSNRFLEFFLEERKNLSEI